MREGFFRTPGRIEEVFRTCTYQRGNLFSINEPHVVTFAIPHGSGTMHIVIDTYKVSLALGFHEHIVAFAGGVRLLGTGNSPLRLAFGKCFSQVVVIPGMKAAHVLGKLRHLQIIHVEVESIYVAVALVLNFNACALLERHSEIARQTGTVFRTGRKRQGCVVVSLIPALSEERADGRLYRRIIVAVPIHANDNVVSAQSGRWRRNRHPNVVDDSHSLDVCNDAFLTWFEGLQVISVTSGRVCTGDSFVFYTRLQLCQVKHFVRHVRLCKNSRKVQSQNKGE